MRPNLIAAPDPSAVIATVTEESQEIAQLSADFHNSKGFRKQSLLATITERVDGLLGIFLNNFDEVPAPSMAREVMATHYPLTETALSKLNAPTVPIVVMRELIYVHRVAIDRMNLDNWTAYSRRYSPAVI